MKTNFKRAICLMLIMVLMLSLFSGCSKSSSESKKMNGMSEEETSLSWAEIKKYIPADAKGKTIEICSWNPLDYVKQSSTIVKRFTEETGIKVKWTVTSDFRNIEVAARIAADDSPDITRVRAASPADLKVLQPLEETGYNFNDTAWDKEVMGYYTVGGKILATTMKNTPYVQHSVVSYNKNLIDNYGLEDPYTLWKRGNWTWDKMHEIAEDFLEMAGDGYKGISQSNLQYANAVGYPNVYFDGNQYKHNLVTNEYLEACKYLSKYYAMGLYSEQPLDNDGFNSGKLLFLVNNSIALRTGHTYYRDLKEKGHVGVVPLPSTEGKEYLQVLGEVEAYGICKGAKNKELAPFFLRYYLDANNYDMNSFYCDEKFLDTIKWMNEQKTAPIDMSGSLMQTDTTGMTHGPFAMDVIRTTPAQLKSKLDSLVPAFDAAMLDYTKQYKQIVADLEKEYG